MLVFKNANSVKCKGLFSFDYSKAYAEDVSKVNGFDYESNDNCMLLRRSLRMTLDRTRLVNLQPDIMQAKEKFFSLYSNDMNEMNYLALAAAFQHQQTRVPVLLEIKESIKNSSIVELKSMADIEKHFKVDLKRYSTSAWKKVIGGCGKVLPINVVKPVQTVSNPDKCVAT